MKNRSHLMRWTGIANACFAMSLLIPSYSFAQVGAANATSLVSVARKQMKQIVLAMHQFYDAHNCFPPQAIVDKKGKPLLSWRVLLLPIG